VRVTGHIRVDAPVIGGRASSGVLHLGVAGGVEFVVDTGFSGAGPHRIPTGLDKPKPSAQRCARARISMNVSNLYRAAPDHTCGSIRIKKGADKPKTSAPDIYEGSVQRVLLHFTSRDRMITLVPERFASKKSPTSLKLRHARSASAQFTGYFCNFDPATA
jgi:hypothetical protein